MKSEYSSTQTFAVSSLVAQYRTLLDVTEAVKQLTNVVFVLLLVEHAHKQLPVI